MRASILCFAATTAMILGLGAGGLAARAADAVVDEEQEINAALAELPDADRELAAAQRWCAVEQDNRLGSMGCPVKVTLDGKPVFLCCSGCVKRANSHAKATLKAASMLTKINVNLSRLTAAERRDAEAQKFCAIKSGVRLGSTGVPMKVMIEGKPIYVCCSGCATQAAENPKEALSKLAALKQKHATR